MAIFIYGLSWSTPKGADVPFVILFYEREIPRVVLDILKKENDWQDRLQGKPIMMGKGEYLLPDHRNRYVVAMLMVTIVLFGSIHLAGWDFAFPTPQERLAWRIMCLASVLLPLIIFWIPLLSQDPSSWLYSWVDLSLLLLWILYLLVRTFVIVEMFRCLLYLPPSAYVSTWASSIPHVG